MSTEPQPNVWQRRFDRSENLTCVLDEHFRVVYCNQAWDRAAEANGVKQATGARLRGQPLLLFVPQCLKYHYSKILEAAREKHIVVFADYECNTPNLYRKYRMKIFPVPESSLLAIVHTLVEKGAIPYRVRNASDDDFGLREVVTMCAQCRRTKLLHDNVWEWVPEFVRRVPPRVTHGVCGDCFAQYRQMPES